MIEKHYSKYITEHSDDISRHALLHHEPQFGSNVVAMGRFNQSSADLVELVFAMAIQKC